MPKAHTTKINFVCKITNKNQHFFFECPFIFFLSHGITVYKHVPGPIKYQKKKKTNPIYVFLTIRLFPSFCHHLKIIKTFAHSFSFEIDLIGHKSTLKLIFHSYEKKNNII